jgi:hypothetical protein
MNPLHSCNRLTRAIDLLTLESDAHQSELLRLQRQIGPQARRDLVGSLLYHSRAIDTLERCQRDLHELLDHPPRLGSAAPQRVVAGPARYLDRPPGVGMVAA